MGHFSSSPTLINYSTGPNFPQVGLDPCIAHTPMLSPPNRTSVSSNVTQNRTGQRCHGKVWIKLMTPHTPLPPLCAGYFSTANQVEKPGALRTPPHSHTKSSRFQKDVDAHCSGTRNRGVGLRVALHVSHCGGQRWKTLKPVLVNITLFSYNFLKITY